MKNNQLLGVAQKLSNVNAHVKEIESQVSLTPVRNTIAGAGYLTANVAAGATSIRISTLTASSFIAYTFCVAIDVGTADCEFRFVTNVSTDPNSGIITLNFGLALSYNHSENDPVIITNSSVANSAWWGAVGNGSTDNYTALNRAIVQAALLTDGSNLIGGSLYIPAGIYNFSGSISITAGDVKIFSDGVSNQHAVLKPTTLDAAFCLTFSTSVGTCEIRDLKFQLSRTDSGKSGLHFSGCDNVAVRNVELVDGEDVAIKITDCTNVDISGNRIVDAELYGIQVAGTSCDQITISHNIIRSPNHVTDDGIYINPTAATNITITGNTVTDTTVYGIYASGVNIISISGNAIYGQSGYNIGLGTNTNMTLGANGLAGTAASATAKVSRIGTLTSFRNIDRLYRFLGPREFEIISGVGVAYTSYFNNPAILMPEGVDSIIGAWWAVSRVFSTTVALNWWIYFVMDTDASPATVYLELLYSRTPNNTAIPAASQIRSDTFTVPTAAGDLAIRRFQMTQSVNGADLVGNEIHRLSSSGNDTATGDLFFLGLAISEPDM